MKMRILLEKVHRKIVSVFLVFIPKKKMDLLIYDSAFPNRISGFRLSEFTLLLEYFKKSKIVVTPTDYPFLGQNISVHREDLKHLKKNNRTVYKKTIAGSILNLNRFSPKILYCVFLHIIYKCLPLLEKNRINFIFTLYPGGGFDVENKTTIAQLERVISSPFFMAVIVTQKFTKDFLVEKLGCPEEKIHFIFGCVIPQLSFKVSRVRKFKKEQDVFNICFCAAKYMEKGLDKGYDIFIDMAKKLILKGYIMKFTIIGGFNQADIDVGDNQEYFDFLGYKKYDELSDIFLFQDVIISPNRPFILAKGAFDGFPLGTVIEACLNGVVPIVTDELLQNSYFKDDEVIITKPNSEEIVFHVENLMFNEHKLYQMSDNVQKKFQKIYNNDYQMQERINVLNQYIK